MESSNEEGESVKSLCNTPALRRIMSIDGMVDLMWSAKATTEGRVLRSRMRKCTMFLPVVAVWDSMLALAASPFAEVRAVIVTWLC